MTRIHATICTNGKPEEAAPCLAELATQADALDRAAVAVVTSGLAPSAHAAFERAADALGAEAIAAPVGLSAARNAALAGRDPGDVVAFCDADVLPDPEWLANLLRRWDEAEADVAAIGGPIRPRFTAEPPSWMSDRVWMAYSLLDLGPDVVEMSALEGRDLWGANFSVRVGPAREEGGFDTWRGAWGPYPLFGEESALQRRLEATGHRLLYAGDVAVEHVIEAERLRLGELGRRQFYRGLSAVLDGRTSPGRGGALAARAAGGTAVALARLNPELAAERWARAAENAGALLAPVTRRRLRRRGWPGP